MLILDASSSMENFDEYKNAVADLIEVSFPEEDSRLAFIQFATNMEVVCDFSFEKSNVEIAQNIRNMEHVGNVIKIF